MEKITFFSSVGSVPKIVFMGLAKGAVKIVSSLITVPKAVFEKISQGREILEASIGSCTPWGVAGLLLRNINDNMMIKKKEKETEKLRDYIKEIAKIVPNIDVEKNLEVFKKNNLSLEKLKEALGKNFPVILSILFQVPVGMDVALNHCHVSFDQLVKVDEIKLLQILMNPEGLQVAMNSCGITLDQLAKVEASRLYPILKKPEGLQVAMNSCGITLDQLAPLEPITILTLLEYSKGLEVLLKTCKISFNEICQIDPMKMTVLLNQSQGLEVAMNQCNISFDLLKNTEWEILNAILFTQDLLKVWMKKSPFSFDQLKKVSSDQRYVCEVSLINLQEAFGSSSFMGISFDQLFSLTPFQLNTFINHHRGVAVVLNTHKITFDDLKNNSPQILAKIFSHKELLKICSEKCDFSLEQFKKISNDQLNVLNNNLSKLPEAFQTFASLGISIDQIFSFSSDQLGQLIRFREELVVVMKTCKIPFEVLKKTDFVRLNWFLNNSEVLKVCVNDCHIPFEKLKFLYIGQLEALERCVDLLQKSLNACICSGVSFDQLTTLVDGEELEVLLKNTEGLEIALKGLHITFDQLKQMDIDCLKVLLENPHALRIAGQEGITGEQILAMDKEKQKTFLTSLNELRNGLQLKEKYHVQSFEDFSRVIQEQIDGYFPEPKIEDSVL